MVRLNQAPRGLQSCVRVLVGLLALACATTAHAGTGDSTKSSLSPLKIPAVTGRVFQKAGRPELSLAGGGVVNDPFYYQLPVSLGLAYHLSEAWSLALQGEYVLTMERGPRVSPGNVPTPTIHHPLYGGWAEVSWAPFYGKVALASSGHMHLDMYLSLGGGVVGDEAGTLHPMGTMALGQRYVLASWCALKLEVRHRFYAQNRLDGVDVGEDRQVFWSGSIGWSVFLPSGE